MTNINDINDIVELLLDPAITSIEEHLASIGKEELAASLNRLSIDAGIDYAKIFDPNYDAAAGPETARISKDYKPVTMERLQLFDELRTLLPNDPKIMEVNEARQQLLNSMGATPPAPPTIGFPSLLIDHSS